MDVNYPYKDNDYDKKLLKKKQWARFIQALTNQIHNDKAFKNYNFSFTKFPARKTVLGARPCT